VNETLLKKKIHLLTESEFPTFESKYLNVRWNSLQILSKIYEDEEKKEIGMDNQKIENNSILFKIKIIVPL
jgi:hypothetical protein